MQEVKGNIMNKPVTGQSSSQECYPPWVTRLVHTDMGWLRTQDITNWMMNTELQVLSAPNLVITPLSVELCVCIRKKEGEQRAQILTISLVSVISNFEGN